ncbi:MULTISPECIES: autotransporter domain-containing protein [Luteimonas]|uniref:autotransporter domain-containing protein n=1 Tax=Luteimonas TaxID=83614 RepID=UPI0018EE36DB|nr:MULTISPECIES: autotransporter domain-containing protein [Luteimonas]
MITSGGTLAFVAAGTCTVNADQTGSASYLPAPQISRSFTVNPVVPDAPTAITATAGDTQASVAFNVPVYTGGSAVTGYTVTSNPGGLTATGAAGPITVNGLTNGISYTFTVAADNAAGTGSASAASNAVTPSAGQAITFANPGAQNFGTTPTLVATAGSGLPVTFSSSTNGVCTVTSGGLLAFVTVGICSINADQAGDASNAPALQVSQSFAVNAVAPGAPVIGSASVAGPGDVIVTFAAPAFAGGVAITGYTVTASPGGITAAGSGSPVTVRGLSPGTPYTFTVTATNAAGTGGASAATASVTPVPALSVAPVATSAAYGAASTPVDLDIAGTPTSVAVASAPTHGIARVSGTAIHYQPAPGYAGPDSFTYTASDAYTTTAPALVTVTVAAPSVALAATAPPAAVGGTAYTHVLAASGGAAPYAFDLVAGRLPQGLALSTGGTLSGTPTESGDFAFTVAAVDSSTGTGPFTAQRAYALVVEAPVIRLSLPENLDAIYGAAFDQTLDATGGTAPYAYAVIDGALPAGLALSASGRLSGAPDAAGRFDVTVQVRDANGFTASQGFELVVSQAVQRISGFASNPAAPVFAPDGTFSVSAEGGASGLPLVFASTTPVVCTVEGSVVTMRAAGQCRLTADQAGDANFEAAPQVRLDVEIAAAVPTLVWPEQINKVLGEAAFALDNPDSPSTGAFAFASSRSEVATVDGRTVTLHGEGTAVITATQAAAGNYAAASIETRLSVTARPDPTRDPGVTGLLQAQVDASVRFAQAQQANIRDRLRQVRSGANASSSNVTLAYDGGAHGQGLSAPVGQAAAGLWPAMPDGWGAWVSGTATVGGSGGVSGYDFDTDGITVGADRALSDQVLVGVAGSLAHNDSQLDAGGGSRMQADQRSLALYGLWRAGEHLFVDALAGTGRLEFDLRRWSSDANALATGARTGAQWFASIAMGYEHRGPAATLTGYSRVETSRSTLDAYREYGLDLYDLDYRRQDVDSTAIALGLEGSYLIGGDTGRVRPFWSVEYREALENRNDATMNYVILPQATDYRFAMRSYNDNAFSLSGGLDVRLARGWALSLLLGHEQARQSTRSSSIGLRLTYGAQGTGARGIVNGTAAAQAGIEPCEVACGTAAPFRPMATDTRGGRPPVD